MRRPRRRPRAVRRPRRGRCGLQVWSWLLQVRRKPDATYNRFDGIVVNGPWPNGEKTVTNAPRVLVVEDEPNIRDLVCLHLGLEGYACEGAGNGQAALQRTERDTFDLLVIDVMLPGLDGVSLCRAVRNGRANRDVPILMLTA